MKIFQNLVGLNEKPSENTMAPVFSRFTFLVFIVVALAFSSPSWAQLGNAPQGKEAWEKFRTIAPHHIQDWVISGEGPSYTLIYSEPPPAYDRDGYEALFQATFRGLKSFDASSSQIGFNGIRTDIIAEMDYGFAGEDALRELEVDLRALSQEIYGTSHGARVLQLHDLEQRPPARDAGPPIAISAAELYDWLTESSLTFASPETGAAGSLSQIRQQRTGRFLSSDGSLALLVIDRRRPVGFSDIRHIRHFVLDSDLIVGGVIYETSDLTYVVGRARQLEWEDFPPLRVEDVLNLIEQENGSLAQSYDRTTPGAGRVTHDDQQQDWAPSFLSRELIDTEFGSLLNEADAVLKSQSLGDTVSYIGFDIDGIPNPPDDTSDWPRGVWDRLNAETRLTSLIFNFNTVGSGHWYVVGDDVRVYAPNRTGSYSVTYSPFGAGETSLGGEAALIAEAEREYGVWFNNSRNLTLSRAVQYTSLFQIFAEPGEVAAPGYADRAARFNAVGDALRSSILTGFEACLPQGTVGEERFEKLQELFEQLKAFQLLGLDQGLPDEFPEDRATLLQWVSKAGAEFRYDGNVFGSEIEELEQAIDALFRQYRAAASEYETARAAYEAQVAKLNELYQVEADTFVQTDFRGRPELDEFGEPKIGVRLERFGRPWNPISSVERRESEEWDRRLRSNNSKATYANRIGQKLTELSERHDALFAESGNRKKLADFVSGACDVLAGTNDTVFDAFKTWTLEADQNEAEVPFLRTPTIVLSRNELDPNFLGGHNVERQGLEVRLAPEAQVGLEGFRLVGNQLTVASNRSAELPALSEAMAKVRNADPVTQEAAFDAVTSTSSGPRVTRSQALGIDAQSARDPAQDGLPIHIASENSPPPPENGLRLGWEERGMYMDQRVDGEVRRAHLFGASYGLPHLLENRLAAHRVAVVEFDPTLDAQTRDAVIDNFVRERPAAAAGGGGKGGDGDGGWRVSGAEPEGPNRGGPNRGEPNRGPRLIVFRDPQTGKSRIVLETTRGRIELVIAQSARRDEVLAALSKPIEQGASLELTEIWIAADGAGGRAAITDFVVRQDAPLGGSVAGFVARGLEAANRTIADAFSGALRRAFSRVTQDDAQPGSSGDLLIEIEASAMETGYFRRVVGKVVVDDHGMRWILYIEPEALEASPDAVRGRDL